MFVKVYAGGELRRMQIDDVISYTELKEKVTQLFPSLKDKNKKFGLQYTDVDGDNITISSDDEVRVALAHLPADHVWRVQVVPAHRSLAQRGRDSAQRSGAMAPFGSFGGLGPWFGRDPIEEMQSDPFWSPMGLFSWDDRERRQREWDDMTRQRQEQMDQEMQRLQRMQEDHMRQFEEQRKKAEQDIQANIQRQRSTGDKTVAQPSGGTAVAQGGPSGWHCQTFGSWEPVSYESPHGRRTVVGPVGYHMYWGYSDPEEPMQAETGKEDEKQEPKDSTST